MARCDITQIVPLEINVLRLVTACYRKPHPLLGSSGDMPRVGRLPAGAWRRLPLLVRLMTS